MSQPISFPFVSLILRRTVYSPSYLPCLKGLELTSHEFLLLSVVVKVFTVSSHRPTPIFSLKTWKIFFRSHFTTSYFGSFSPNLSLTKIHSSLWCPSHNKKERKKEIKLRILLTKHKLVNILTFFTTNIYISKNPVLCMCVCLCVRLSLSRESSYWLPSRFCRPNYLFTPS